VYYRLLLAEKAASASLIDIGSDPLIAIRVLGLFFKDLHVYREVYREVGVLPYKAILSRRNSYS
jgi:hypothetical protein